MRLSVYISDSIYRDLQRISEAMKIANEPGIMNTSGEMNGESAVVQRLIVIYREELKSRPSPEEGKSMWEFLQERVSSNKEMPTEKENV